MTHWVRALKRTSHIAGVFVVLVLIGLVANAIWVRNADPVPPTTVDGLVARLNQDAKNPKLLEDIRRQDLWIREGYLRSERFAQAGFLLLLGGAIVWLLCVKGARSLESAPHAPNPDAPIRARSENLQSRQSLAATAVVLGGGLLMVMVLSRHDAANAYMLDSRMPQPGSAAKQERGGPGIPDAAELPMAELPPARAAAPDSVKAIPLVPDPAGTRLEPLPIEGAEVKKAGAKPATVPSSPGAIEPLPSTPGTWPWFRGVGAGTVSGEIPTTWNGASGEGILWQSEVPLPGWGSPIVWGGMVFLSGAEAGSREVFAFSAKDGKIAWRTAVPVLNSDAKVYKDTGYAPATLAADSRHVVAVFANGDVAGFGHDGRRLWSRTFGPLDNQYGHASCPIIVEGRLILQIDQGTSAEDGKSRLIALDPATGKDLWTTARPVASAWSSPIAATVLGKTVVVLCGNPFVICYSVADGKEVWRADGMAGEVAPSAAFGDGCIYVAQSGGQAMALRASDGKPVWTNYELALPDVSSPAYLDGLVYLASPDGTLSALDAKSGKAVWEHALGKPGRASLLAAGKHILVFSKDGSGYVLESGKTFKLLRTNPLGDSVSASPAVVDGRLYVRTEKRLYCLGGK